MTKIRRIVLIIIIIILTLLNYQKYYNRNYKVDDDFLQGIVETTKILEEKRVNNIDHTWDDDLDTHTFLNHGYMASNSNLEIDIKGNVSGMSGFLYEYYDENIKGNELLAEKKMDKYFSCLNDLEELLTPMREKRPQLEVLWEKGIFKE